MLHEQRKAGKVIAELTMYFLALGAKRVSSSVTLGDRDGKITFEADSVPESGKRLAELEKCLNQQRNSGIEEVYWELAGEGTPGDSSQLLLIGTMIDKAEISLEDGIVRLALYKSF